MMRLAFIALFWILTYYKSDWRDWRRFQSTILFMIAGDFAVTLITYNYTLWDLSTRLGGHLVNDFLLSVLFFPAATLLFLSNYPERKGFVLQSLYLLVWAISFTLIEVVEYALSNIHYKHGWSLWKSFFINITIFPTLRIHYVKPILAYFLFLIEVILLIFICGIPISSFK